MAETKTWLKTAAGMPLTTTTREREREREREKRKRKVETPKTKIHLKPLPRRVFWVRPSL